MDNKKLSDNELEKVDGGQAVLPLLSGTNGKEEDEMIIKVGYAHAHCPFCDGRFPVPESQRGKQVECQHCGKLFTVK